MLQARFFVDEGQSSGGGIKIPVGIHQPAEFTSLSTDAT